MEAKTQETTSQVITTKEVTVAQIECQYQAVVRKKDQIDNNPTENLPDIDDIFKKAVPKNSFLHKYHAKSTEKTSYAPMDVGKEPTKSFFRLSYEYPYWSKFRGSKADNFNDHGYYLIRKENKPVDKVNPNTDTKTLKLKAVSTTEQIDLCCIEEHFYEDLCYVDNKKISKVKRRNSTGNVANPRNFRNKIQEIFSVIKVPFKAKLTDQTVSTAVKVNEDLADEKSKREVKVDNEKAKKVKEQEKVIDLYENSGSVGNLYDVVNPIPRKVICEAETTPDDKHLEKGDCKESIYCDVAPRVGDKSDSMLDFILSFIENMFSKRREINDDLNGQDKTQPITTVKDGSEIQKSSANDRKSKINMASRPLPVPVDNEPYFMNIGRNEAEEMLLGQPDGCFILRPSSQPSHEYTLSVSCGRAVHNVGVRKRPDGRLALGFERKSERCFSSIEGLVRHHRRRRLLLVASGAVLGGTALTEPPLYYLTPSSLPVVAEDQTSL